MMLDAAGDQEGFEEAAVKLKAKEAQLRNYVDQHEGLHRRKDREQVVGFDRRLSAEAVAANKRSGKRSTQLDESNNGTTKKKSLQTTRKGNSYDRDQFDRYKKVLGDDVPDELDDFLKLKYNDKTEYGKLKHAYRIVNQYESNSGNMAPADIVRLHDNAVERKAKFTGKARKNANMGIMELDGKTYIANSNVNDANNAAYKNYKGDKAQIVLEPENPVFHPLEVGSYVRKNDSEYKMFEYASIVASDGREHSIRMLSERTMCSSCESVMKEFCEKHPNVKVEVVSHKKEKAAKNKNENPIFKIDVERKYKHENDR